nr:xylulose kinase-1 [Tanacetum cinerariifolium]
MIAFKHGRMIADMDEDVKDIDEEEPANVEEVLKVVKAAKLFTEVVTTAKPTTTAAQVPKASAPRRIKGVVIQDPEETASSVIVHTEVHPKKKGKGILIEEPKPLKHQTQIEQDEAFARQLEDELNANINWNNSIEQVKKSERQMNEVMSEIRPLFEKHYNLIQAFLEKEEEEVIVQEKETKEEGSKRQGESLEQEIVKKQMMDKEAAELKRHLQIVANDDDDVYTEATPQELKVLPPNTAEEVVAKERERKVRTTLLMALPEDHLAKFHKMADAKEIFQTLLSELEIHGASVSHEDANHKFLWFLPSSWSQVALIMRTKPGLDTLSFDDLYNNLRVFERDVKGTTASSLSNIQNMAFVSVDNTSSNND